MATSTVVTEWRADVGEALSDLENLENATIEVAETSERAGMQLRQSMTAVSTGTARATRGMRNMKGANTQINQLLLESGFVAQDAAFGFRGIANNIPGVVRAFNSARAAAGSTNALLSSLASSITGPAGVLFATNALVGILTVASTQFDLFSGGVDDADQSLEDLREELDLEGELRVVREQTQGWERDLRDVQNAAIFLAETIGRPLLEPMFAWLRLTRDINLALLEGLAQSLDQATGHVVGFTTRFDQLTDTVDTNQRVTGDWIETFEFLNEEFDEWLSNLTEFDDLNIDEALRQEEFIPDAMVRNLEQLNEQLNRTMAEDAFRLLARNADVTEKEMRDLADTTGNFTTAFDRFIRQQQQMQTLPQTADQVMGRLNRLVQERIPEGIEQTRQAAEEGSEAANQISAGFDLATASIRAAKNEAQSFQNVASSILQAIGGLLRATGQRQAGAAVSGLGGVIGAFQHGGVIDTPLAITGEAGPEMLVGAQGTRVINNRETERIIERTGMGGSDRIVSELQGIQRAVKQNRLAIDAFAFQESSRTTDRLLTDAGFPPNG